MSLVADRITSAQAAPRYGALLTLPTLGAFLYLPTGTRLYPVELLAVTMLPMTLPRMNMILQRVSLVSLGASLWCLNGVVSELWRHESVDSVLQSLLTPLFFIADLALILWLTQLASWRRLVASLVVALLIGGAIQPESGVLVNPWKFWLAIPVAICLVAAAERQRSKGKPLVATFLILSCVVLNVILDFRSLASILLIAASAPLASRLLLGGTRLGLLRLALVSLLVGYLVLQGYSWTVSNGLATTTAATRLKQQSAGKYGPLLAGRKESVPMLFALRESPFVGYGVNASLSSSQLAASIEFYRQAGYTVEVADVNYLSQSPFPAHSTLLGSWFHQGIFGGAFWIYLATLVWRSSGPLLTSRLSVASTLVWMTWTILFSPLGAGSRWVLAFAVAWLLIPASRPTSCMDRQDRPAQTSGQGVEYADA